VTAARRLQQLAFGGLELRQSLKIAPFDLQLLVEQALALLHELAKPAAHMRLLFAESCATSPATA